MKTIIPGVLALSALLMTASVSAQTAAAPAAAAAQKASINLNTATLDQLETLPGIGRKTAERILEQRQKSGGFKKIEELMNIKGIGEKSFLKIKPMVFVTPKSDKAGGGGF
jgi:competence protein ComEA